ncbi:MAG TPA: PEP-CTERM sorting domain-containing protein [Bryobacteraceae bacterium]|nr:PEP-CTERM sorting domain-containing protein [Bryobacteraceae bacterium]
MTKRFLLTGLVSLLFAGLASADTLPYQTWVTEPFTLMNSGDFFPDVLVAGHSGTLLVTGYYVTGDYYDVYDNGQLVLSTAQVPPTDVDYGDDIPSLYADPASAFASGLFSTGEVTVQAGDQITIQDFYPPSGIGEVGAEIVPEPASIALLGGELLAIAAFLRRRRRP